MRYSAIPAAAIFLLASCMVSPTDAAHPERPRTPASFVEIADFPSAFVQARGVTIWLPDGYVPSAAQRYPVIYAHDGQNLFHEGHSADGGKSWSLDETARQMMTEGRIRPAIIVGIWSTDKRWEEYAPQRVIERLPASVLADSARPAPDLLSDAYLRFIVEELKPHVDGAYKTAPDAANTFIMGSSMGGLISLYAAAEYPGVFGRAACVSTHWPLAGPETAVAAAADAAMISYLASDAKLDPASQRLWFDTGTLTLDAFYPPHATAIEAWFRSAGWSEAAAGFHTFEGTSHSESSWSARVDLILEFLLEN